VNITPVLLPTWALTGVIFEDANCSASPSAGLLHRDSRIGLSYLLWGAIITLARIKMRRVF